MSKYRLGREDLDELKELTKVHRYFQHATRALDLYNNLWKSQKIQQKGLDSTSGYEINLETGNIRITKKDETEIIQEDGDTED